MHRLACMEPNNPRWETAEVRRARSATFWKVIVTAAAASAFTAVIVASCLDRDDEALRGLDEPGYVETTSAVSPSGVSTSASTADSVGGIAPMTTTPAPAPAGATATAPAPAATDTTTITSGEPNYSPRPVPFTVAAPVVAPPAQPGATTAAPAPTAPPAPPAPAAAPEAGAPVQGGAAPDAGVAPQSAAPAQRGGPVPHGGSNPWSPPMSAGAGPFITEAPYWSSSAFESNPEAGAGPFTTERNTPAR